MNHLFLRICAVVLTSALLSACVDRTLSVGSGEVASKRGGSYGSGAHQRYKAYFPSNVKPSTPVIVFVHGGGWKRAERKRYSFVGKSLAKQGFVAVTVGYRVYPQVRFPTFVDDVAMAVAKIRKTISPARPLFLVGHSAGAHIAGMLTYDKSYLAKQGLNVCRDIAGFVGLAGPYDFNPRKHPKFAPIFPPQSRGKDMPIDFATARTPPVLLLHGSSDKFVPIGHSRRFHAKLKSVGSSARFKVYKGVGHVGILGAYTSIVPTSANTVADVASFIRANATAAATTCR